MVSETHANGSRERTQPTMALDQSALLEVLEMLKAAPDVGTGGPGSWTEPSLQPVRSGPSAARLRGIRAASAPDAPGRSSHNPPVVGSSPTRPTGSNLFKRSKCPGWQGSAEAADRALARQQQAAIDVGQPWPPVPHPEGVRAPQLGNTMPDQPEITVRVYPAGR